MTVSQCLLVSDLETAIVSPSFESLFSAQVGGHEAEKKKILLRFVDTKLAGGQCLRVWHQHFEVSPTLI